MTEENTIPQGYWDNSRWAREHSTELHKQYRDVWVAISDRKVVAVGADPVSVRKIASRKTGRSTAEIAVKFIESGLTISHCQIRRSISQECQFSCQRGY